MRYLAQIDLLLLKQRGHLFPWAPVALAVGIGFYFLLRFEPGWLHYASALGIGLVAGCAALRWPGGLSALGWGVALIALGFCLSGLRAHLVAGPVLDFRYYGPIEGRVVGVDRSAGDAVRVRLDQVHLKDVAAWKTPAYVRVSLHGDAPGFTLEAGQRVMTTGHLSPPGGPVEPGGFDFRRHAWFQGLGAVGYTRTPLLLAAPAQAGRTGLWVLGIRMAVSARIIAVQGGDIGGFGAAVTTGDRSGVSQEALEWLRASNTAHLLAISGLHMGLLVGFVFALLRYGLALIPSIALRWPTRKLAAGGALVAAILYLALSGGNVATERAFIMAAVMLIAVMLDRRAFSLRSVAIAALIVLALRPEAMMGPGFQMSFAATTALVAAYGALRDRQITLPGPAWAQGVVGVLTSSLIAGLATAPVAAAHFNAIAHYGLLANMLSVPVMGTLVVPAAVLAALLAPFGLEAVGLWIMGWGIQWILWVAEWVAGMSGARSFVASPPAAFLPVLAFGLLVLMLWQGAGRWLGLLPVAVAAWLWAGSERPELLIAEGGNLVGVMTPEGRALSKPRGAGFVARVWLENDGERVPQSLAALRWEQIENGIARVQLGDWEVVHVTGKRAARGFSECRADQLVIAGFNLALEGPCQILDSRALRRTGSLAIRDGRLITAQEVSGTRLWNAERRPRRTDGATGKIR